jgi:hypothetical protein
MGTEPESPLELAFDIEFFEGVQRRAPDYVQVLEILGSLYTRVGRIDDGLRIDQQLVKLRPDCPTAHYNLACSLCLKGRLSDSLRSLRRAALRGYRDVNWMLKDSDLQSLYKHPAFKALVAALTGSSLTGTTGTGDAD